MLRDKVHTIIDNNLPTKRPWEYEDIELIATAIAEMVEKEYVPKDKLVILHKDGNVTVCSKAKEFDYIKKTLVIKMLKELRPDSEKHDIIRIDKAIDNLINELDNRC